MADPRRQQEKTSVFYMVQEQGKFFKNRKTSEKNKKTKKISLPEKMLTDYLFW
jgi:hypothetical protein